MDLHSSSSLTITNSIIVSFSSLYLMDDCIPPPTVAECVDAVLVKSIKAD